MEEQPLHFVLILTGFFGLFHTQLDSNSLRTTLSTIRTHNTRHYHVDMGQLAFLGQASMERI